MENLQINQGIKFLVGDGKGVIGTGNPSVHKVLLKVLLRLDFIFNLL